MKQILSTCGKTILIDDSDYTAVSRWKWQVNKRGYVRRTVKTPGVGDRTGHTVLLHRFLFSLTTNERHLRLDHRNGNKLDNQRSNLRFATQSQNLQNSLSANMKRGQFKGVHQVRQRFFAAISVGGRTVCLGGYPTAIEAARAYNAAAVKYYGEFAKLNPV